VEDLAFGFDMSSFRQGSGKPAELAPDHDPLPLDTAVVQTGIVLPARLRDERKRTRRNAIFELARFGIGLDEPDEVNVTLEHKKYLLSLARLCRAPRKREAAPKPEEESI